MKSLKRQVVVTIRQAPQSRKFPAIVDQYCWDIHAVIEPICLPIEQDIFRDTL